MIYVYVSADGRLIATHNPSNVVPLEAYADNGATERHAVLADAVRMALVNGMAQQVLVDGWRDMIVELSDA